VPDLLWADNVSFRYAAGAPLVVDGVTVRLADGALAGILGPNGSGKTTLLRLLSGARRPSSGRVLLGPSTALRASLSTALKPSDRPLDQLSRREAARQIAVVPQDTELAFEYRAIEIVLMGRHPHLGMFAVEGPDDIRIAENAMAATGISELADRMFHELSGGEKQRVVIASALAQLAVSSSVPSAPSAALLLDEPTASLDLRYQLEISSLLLRLNQEHGVTMAISTHDLNLAASICRELVMMRDGRVLAAGPTAEVLTPDNVKALYDVEADVHVHGQTGHMTVVPVRLATPKRAREGGRIPR